MRREGARQGQPAVWPGFSPGSVPKCPWPRRPLLPAPPVAVCTQSSGTELPAGAVTAVGHTLFPGCRVTVRARHCLLVLFSLQNANGEVTDFLSFYTLPSTIMNHPTHKSLKAAYSFYNVHTQTPLLDLMSDALVLAKMVRSRPEGPETHGNRAVGAVVSTGACGPRLLALLGLPLRVGRGPALLSQQLKTRSERAAAP